MIDFMVVVLTGVLDIGKTFIDFITFDTGYTAAYWQAVAAGIGGLLGLGSQSSANKANLQAARETNEMNYKIFKEGNEFNEYMADKAWDREIAYNDPAAQLARYQAAGINGQVAMSGSLGSAGTTSADYAAPSSVAPPMMQAPTVQPLDFTPFAQMAAAVGQIAQAKKAGAETKEIESMMADKWKALKLDNDTKEYDLAVKRLYDVSERNQKLRNMTAEYAKMCAEKVAAYAQGRYFDESALERMEQSLLHQANAKLKSEEYRQFVELFPLVKQHHQALIDTERSKQNANNAAAEDSRAGAALKREQKNTELKEQVRLDEVAKMTKAERYKLIENSISIYEDANGVHLSSEKREQVADELYRQMMEETKQSEKRTRQQGADYWNPFKYVGQLLGGAAGSVIKLIK